MKSPGIGWSCQLGSLVIDNYLFMGLRQHSTGGTHFLGEIGIVLDASLVFLPNPLLLNFRLTLKLRDPNYDGERLSVAGHYSPSFSSISFGGTSKLSVGRFES